MDTTDRHDDARTVGEAAETTGPESDCFAQQGLPRRFGRYSLLRLLARGGMGEVFLAKSGGVEGAERPVVVKVIRREYARDPNFLARFLDEARVQAQLQHSGVAQVLEAALFEPTGDPYVVMEHVEGRSLGQVRRRVIDVGARLRWEDAVAVGALVTEALAYVHERTDAAGKPLCIVHRDLSPHNLMVGYGGEVKIIDFGTARGQNRRCHTVAGVVFAKPGYVAPEVANGDPGDARVDLYAAGIMLWELCAGRRFLQDDAADHMAAVARNERNPPPIARDSGAPPALDEVIEKMTAFAREDRFATAREASSRLAQLLRAADPLPNGERGTRARVAQLMYNLYPAEPGRSRRAFARLVRSAEEAAAGPVMEPDAPDAQLEESGVLCGTRYRVRRTIGRGGSGVVYEAEHVDLGTRVALKVLDAEHTHSKHFAARFRREARALSRLDHPGLVRVMDFGQAADGRLFCVMELLEGSTLATMLANGEIRDWKHAARLARQACVALAAAHRGGVVHRDLKPANLFVTNGGRVKLIDFGLAKTAEEVSEPPGQGADLGAMTLFGTPEYMAPEQVAGQRVDERADLYALGCVLYEMLTDRLPFAGSSAVAVLDAKLRGNPEPARERAPSRGIPRSVDAIVLRALARHRSRRFVNAAAMASALAHALDEPTRRRVRRRAMGGAMVAMTMAFAAVLLGHHLRGDLPPIEAVVPWLGLPDSPADDTTRGDGAQAPAVGEGAARHAGTLHLQPVVLRAD